MKLHFASAVTSATALCVSAAVAATDIWKDDPAAFAANGSYISKTDFDKRFKNTDNEKILMVLNGFPGEAGAPPQMIIVNPSVGDSMTEGLVVEDSSFGGYIVPLLVKGDDVFSMQSDKQIHIGRNDIFACSTEGYIAAFAEFNLKVSLTDLDAKGLSIAESKLLVRDVFREQLQIALAPFSDTELLQDNADILDSILEPAISGTIEAVEKQYGLTIIDSQDEKTVGMRYRGDKAAGLSPNGLCPVL